MLTYLHGLPRLLDALPTLIPLGITPNDDRQLLLRQIPLIPNAPTLAPHSPHVEQSVTVGGGLEEGVQLNRAMGVEDVDEGGGGEVIEELVDVEQVSEVD